jgi:hypothetical protein
MCRPKCQYYIPLTPIKWLRRWLGIESTVACFKVYYHYSHGSGAFNKKSHQLGFHNSQTDLLEVKLSLCLVNYAPRHEYVWGSGGMAQPFLTSSVDGGKWLASHLSHFTPKEGAPGTQWTGGRVGLRGGLEAVEKIKSPDPAVDQTLAVQPVVLVRRYKE